MSNFSRLLRLSRQCSLLSNNAVSSNTSRCCSTFKSLIHTDNVYPGSNLASKYARFDVTKLPTKDHIFSGYIPMNEIHFSYSLSSGAGGQNVQKVKTTFISITSSQSFSAFFSESNESGFAVPCRFSFVALRRREINHQNEPFWPIN